MRFLSFLSSLWPAAIRRQLHEGGERSTFERLSTSRHVADLRLIFSVAVIIVVLATVLAWGFCFYDQMMTRWGDIQSSHSDWIWLKIAFAAVRDSGMFIGAVGAVGCGVVAWTYQAGSARLGVVDLFACEIATLCRVASVTDMVGRYIALFDAEPDSRLPVASGPGSGAPAALDGGMPTDSRFASQEAYFPVFDASVKDLQLLEADVVDNVTIFYTYFKAMRDGLRKLSELYPSAEPGRQEEWRRIIGNIVYMQFLGLESARQAIVRLVEFLPARAERHLYDPVERAPGLRLFASGLHRRSARAAAGGARGRLSPDRSGTFSRARPGRGRPLGQGQRRRRRGHETLCRNLPRHGNRACCRAAAGRAGGGPRRPRAGLITRLRNPPDHMGFRHGPVADSSRPRLP